MSTIRPRRSVLYMPGSNARAIEKARTLDADALILDLEDAVSPDAKEFARKQVCEAVVAGGFGHREIAIRVNGIDTPWGHDDIKAAAAAKPDAILVPKISSAAMIHEIEGLLEKAGAASHTRLWAMMETPHGILRALEVAGSSQRLAVLVMGTNDIAKELHATHVAGRAPLLGSLSTCLLAARAHGLAILDGVYNDIEDAQGFAAECVQGMQMGFDGKTLIHPSEVEPCNAVFSPSAAELETARRIITAFDEAKAQGRGVATVDGRMIENLHVESAKRAVAMAAAIAARRAA